MDFKPVEYYKVNFFDLLQLMRDELGIVVRGDKITGGNAANVYAWDNYDFEPADDMYPFGQNTFLIVSPDEFEESLEWFHEHYGVNCFDTYMKQLYEKNLLPTDRPIFVEISW